MTEYYYFRDEIQNRRNIATVVECSDTVQELSNQLAEIGREWWNQSWPSILSLTEGDVTPPQLEYELIESLRASCEANTILDKYEVAGVLARWWRLVHWDLHTLTQGGAIALIEGWSQSYLATLGDVENKDLPLSEVEEGVRNALIPTYANDLAQAQSTELQRNAEIQILDYGDDWESMTPEDRKLEQQGSKVVATDKRVLKAERKMLNDYVKQMEKGATIKSGISIAKLKKEGMENEALEAEIQVEENKTRIAVIDAELEEIQQWQDRYKELSNQRKDAKARIKELGSSLWIEEQMKARLETIEEDEATVIAGEIMSDLFQSQLVEEIRLRQEKVVKFLESCWDRYRENLREIEHRNEEIKTTLDTFLGVLYNV